MCAIYTAQCTLHAAGGMPAQITTLAAGGMPAESVIRNIGRLNRPNELASLFTASGILMR